MSITSAKAPNNGLLLRSHSHHTGNIPGSGAYLDDPPLVHGAQDEKGVGRPLDVLNLIQASVQLEELEGGHVPNDEPVLHTRSLGRTKSRAEPLCQRQS